MRRSEEVIPLLIEDFGVLYLRRVGASTGEQNIARGVLYGRHTAVVIEVRMRDDRHRHGFRPASDRFKIRKNGRSWCTADPRIDQNCSIACEKVLIQGPAAKHRFDAVNSRKQLHSALGYDPAAALRHASLRVITSPANSAICSV